MLLKLPQLIEDIGALVHYLPPYSPPYSPDFNPIEDTFSKVKSALKSTEVEMTGMTDVEDLLLASFAQVTQEDCEEWVSRSGIYT